MASNAAIEIQKNEDNNSYFEVIWNQVWEHIKSKINGNSQRKRRVLKVTKNKLQTEFDEMVAKSESIERIFETIADKISSRFEVPLELKLDMHGDVKCYLNEQPRKRFRWTIKKDDVNKTRLENARSEIQRLGHINEQQAKHIDILKEKNASLSLRNADFTRLKITQQLGEKRSSLLVDAALFSNAFHRGDHLMQEQDPKLLDGTILQGLKKRSLGSGNFTKSEKASFPDGDSVAIKTLNGSFGLQALAVTSHEHRILTFIGKHQNIVQTVGLVHSDNCFSHVLDFESGLTLETEIKEKFSVSFIEFKDHINGIADGLQHLFSRGVLHNYLTTSNILLRGNTPVIMGFTFACREQCGKPNVQHVLQRFDNQSHFAPELFKGSKISYSSDVYSFGLLLQKITKRKLSFKLNYVLKGRLEVMIQHCLQKSPGKRLPHLFLQDRLRIILEAS
ncbi:uncharacterized protein [Clytia hemisphaerica]|uniref:uncharacterized protein isoform X3 n=1 Tax=Clytia hemisphaerica TaxID=252671 RepID=UPI0034D733E4